MTKATCLAIALTLASGAFAKRSHDLPRPRPGEEIDVIVQYKTQPSERNFDRARGRGGKIKQQHRHLPMAVMRLKGDALDEAEKDP
ncbi:MAG: hypothetical protein FJW39_26955, partial [Acidobacteria bacterium]|nr:hypothetical protein [Acidobacteriota bacterium]